jgi:hypothetical protein
MFRTHIELQLTKKTVIPPWIKCYLTTSQKIPGRKDLNAPQGYVICTSPI